MKMDWIAKYSIEIDYQTFGTYKIVHPRIMFVKCEIFLMWYDPKTLQNVQNSDKLNAWQEDR